MPHLRQACRIAAPLAAPIAALGVLGTALLAPPAAAQAPSPSPSNFARAAAQSDQFEILEGDTALAQSQDPRVRAFAQAMVRDHGRTSQALEQAVMKSGLPPPPKGLGGDQAKLLYSLQGQRGPEFDRLYATQQVLAHQEALTEQQAYAARGSDPNLRQAAAAAVPVIQGHLQMAQQLRAAVGSH